MRIAIALDIARIRLSWVAGAVAVNLTVEVLEGCGAQGHDDSTQDEETDSAFERHLFEDGIGVALIRQCFVLCGTDTKKNSLLIVLEALLNPEPISSCDQTGQAKSRDNGDGPWGREEQQVNQQHDRWNSVEANVCTSVRYSMANVKEVNIPA